mmetsp:Transcript_16797/g.46931  ORF Transcript_16797/g.46931 Transcript_16797/m.46931 type:complete len:884 (+) Transcript_16797:140-2791(+)|eukprot:CAMPEP_0117663272 /NCGR_PEP_ID=MMETSP0804-20121206/8514_1 /TAXON_ID=1074897 /ORGANISM="Tetraselmis astigmatica, Strain CCMP880" /LENGTH=883 /DNA_ID=CAMNT_0005470259 /DNA_START=96 /DNA_END=2747 /DNA_ORIENTATION=+
MLYDVSRGSPPSPARRSTASPRTPGGSSRLSLSSSSAAKASTPRRDAEITEKLQPTPADQVAGQPLPDRVLVFARCRPSLEKEQGAAPPEKDSTVPPSASPATARGSVGRTCIAAASDDKKVALRSLDGTPLRDARDFVFDGVFDESSLQADVYQAVARPVLREVLCGYHGCIMAYGQTGSGKTHSLLNPGAGGDLTQAGLVPRLAADLFTQTAADAMAKYEVEIGMFQIYNEQVDDLLCSDKQNLKIKQEQNKQASDKTSWYVDGLSWRAIDSAAELLECLAAARKRLVYAETKMNKHSSRSHCVVLIKVVRQEVPAGMLTNDGKVEATPGAAVKVRQTMGQLTIVDLAGSERIKKSAAQDKRLKEAININTSLLMLGNVIQSLASRQSHVPFRDSSLTRMLESSLSGNSRCAMLVCLAPEPSHVSESLSTLEFASRAMRVETRPVLHEATVELDPRELAAQLASHFESDVAMRSQVELAQLKHALNQQLQKTSEANRRERGAAAQAADLESRLSEEVAARAAAEAEVRELLRQLESKTGSLKKAKEEKEAEKNRCQELERALADAKAATEASNASMAAARDAARAAKETASAVQNKLEMETSLRKQAEVRLDETHAEAERRHKRMVSSTAQTDSPDGDSDDEDLRRMPTLGRKPSALPCSGGAMTYRDPYQKAKERKEMLVEAKEELKDKMSLISALERQLYDANHMQSRMQQEREELESTLVQERQQTSSIVADTEKRTEKLFEEWQTTILRTGIVCTKRGRNNKEYTRVVRLAEDLQTLEWAAVKEFKQGLHVSEVAIDDSEAGRPVTTIKGLERSTSIVPQGQLQEQWVAALSRHISSKATKTTARSPESPWPVAEAVTVITDPGMRSSSAGDSFLNA